MKNNSERKRRIVLILFSVAVGSIIGAVVWGFMRVMHLLVTLLWDYIPNSIHIPGYTVILCLIGGVVIGLIQKYKGPCPDDLHQVMAKYKRDGKYPYGNIPFMLTAALLPLIFGGAVGPEAGLTGVIVGLCCWAGDNFKYAGKYISDLTEIGIAATLGVLFRSPLFGFVEPIENEDGGDDEFVMPKPSKIATIFCASLAGLGTFVLLGKFFGMGAGMPKFESVTVGKSEMLFAIPILVIGMVLGYVYKIFENTAAKVAELSIIKNRLFLKAVIAALVLGIIGTFFPIAMFSGEEEIPKIGVSYLEYSPYVLILISIVKVLLINVCIKFGWRGGNFFPLIFAGVCLGYACSAIFSVDPVFAVSVVAAATMTTIIRKPLAVTLLLLICFPISNLMYILAAAFIASVVPVPKFLTPVNDGNN